MRSVDTLLVRSVALLAVATAVACAGGGSGDGPDGAAIPDGSGGNSSSFGGSSTMVLSKGGGHSNNGQGKSGSDGTGNNTGGDDGGSNGAAGGTSNVGGNDDGGSNAGTSGGGSNVTPNGGRSGGSGGHSAGSSSGGTGSGGKGNSGGASSGGTSSGGKGNSGGTSSGGTSSGGKGNSGGTSSGGTGSAGAAGGTVLFTTDFNLTENPISESSKWKRSGLDWTSVITANGYAFGTQVGNAGFNDSYAYLAGTFPANQSATAVIHLESGLSPYQEVEILLRWRDSAHSATGYECNLAYNGQYAEIIIWPGPLGTDKSQFKWVSSGNPVSGGVHDGDIFQADVIGNVITARLNGKVIATGTDSSIPSGGAPGMGFYAEGAPASQKFSFSKFTATGL